MSCQLIIKTKSQTSLFAAFIGQEYTITAEVNLGKRIPFLKLSFISDQEIKINFPLVKGLIISEVNVVLSD